eukprot:44988_1
MQNPNHDADFSDQSEENWGDVEVIDHYLCPQHVKDTEEHQQSETTKWICHNCNYENDRCTVIKQNFVCSNCNNKLNIEQEEKKSEVISKLPFDELVNDYQHKNKESTHHIIPNTEINLQPSSNTPTISCDKLQNKTVSQLMLPKQTKTLLPINMKPPIKSSIDHTTYRPSLSNGIYGSYCMIFPFSSFKFPVKEIKTNLSS